MKSAKYILILAAMFISVAFAQKETPPKGSAPKDFSLPKRETISLPNGLQASLIRYGNVPKAMIRVVVRTGNIDEKNNETWLADLTGEFLSEGTASKNAEAVATAAANMGGSLNINTGLDQSFVAGEVLSEFTPDFIKLSADVIQNPAFPASELERLKSKMLRDLSVQSSTPQSQALEKYSKVMYGDHAYGRTFPTEAMLKSYTLDQVKSFYVANFSAKRTHIFVVGVFDPAAVTKAIREAFGDWKEGTPPTQNVPQAKSERTIYLIDRPGAPQSTIILGLPTMDASHPDYVKFLIMNSILGGSFGSRITTNIRENKGYTYSPFSAITSRYHSANWSEQADVTTEHTGASIKEILYEIERLKKEPPAKDELEGIQNYQAGIFVLQNSNFNGIVNQLAFLNLHGLPDTYLSNYVKNVYAVTPEDVSNMAKSQLKDDAYTIVIVGDIAKIEKQVKLYGKIVK
ncbi:MAG TPA: pitrilysin family protein [bacterium]|nr:pitrilysin family protein [bacterium]